MIQTSVESFLTERYKHFCDQILLDRFPDNKFVEKYCACIEFFSVIDFLKFMVLYEDNEYENALKDLKGLIVSKLYDLPLVEKNFLLIKPIENGEYERVWADIRYTVPEPEYLIADECIKIIHHKVLSSLLGYKPSLKTVIESLIGDIKNFAYTGSLEGDGYKLRNYWEEYCFQVQYGDGLFFDIVFEAIEEHIQCNLHNMLSMKEVILLYIETKEYNYNIDYEEQFFVLPTKSEMINAIVPLIIENLNLDASKTYIPNFRCGEEWEEEG